MGLRARRFGIAALDGLGGPSYRFPQIVTALSIAAYLLRVRGTTSAQVRTRTGRIRLSWTAAPFMTIPLPADFGTFHTNPKRKRGKDLSPRLRFALSVSLDRERYKLVNPAAHARIRLQTCSRAQNITCITLVIIIDRWRRRCEHHGIENRLWFKPGLHSGQDGIPLWVAPAGCD